MIFLPKGKTRRKHSQADKKKSNSSSQMKEKAFNAVKGNIFIHFACLLSLFFCGKFSENENGFGGIKLQGFWFKAFEQFGIYFKRKFSEIKSFVWTYHS